MEPRLKWNNKVLAAKAFLFAHAKMFLAVIYAIQQYHLIFLSMNELTPEAQRLSL